MGCVEWREGSGTCYLGDFASLRILASLRENERDVFYSLKTGLAQRRQDPQRRKVLKLERLWQYL
jgi:hypothetical protein